MISDFASLLLTLFLFVYVVRFYSILHEFTIFAEKHVIYMDFSLETMLKRLVLKNLIQRTSQRVKRTFTARVMAS